MTAPLQAYIAPVRAGNTWFYVGPASSFVDIDESGSVVLAEQLPSEQPSSADNAAHVKSRTACRVFKVPREDSSKASEVVLGNGTAEGGLDDEVLVFRYRGTFHAVDHVCEVKSEQ